MASDDDDIPASGAVFTFGKSRFADNTANKFWIRNDKAVQVSCGDDHSALVTENGRLYVFGANDWGQLGLGHTKTAHKPSSVKGLKHAGVVQVACGRVHTVALTRELRLHSFGAGGEGQLGVGNTKQYESPMPITVLQEQAYLMISCGTDHSAALAETGTLYTWGGGSEGQLGHGEVSEVDIPKELSMGIPIRMVSCGYYHTALLTEDKRLFTFGEGEGGKLGLGDDSLEGINEPKHVSFFKESVDYVSCGNAHTAAVTEKGHVYTFGDGASGQLGLGLDLLQTSTPKRVTKLEWTTCKLVSCGESHTAVVTAKGCLYTFGDGRHGKLAQGEESFSNIFIPNKVHRFKGFLVEQVSCGGCHTLVRARRRNQPEDSASDSEPEEVDPNKAGDTNLSSTMGTNLAKLANSIDLQGSLNGSMGGTARVRRRQREGSPLPPLSRTLPPLGSSTPKSLLSSLPQRNVPLNLKPLNGKPVPKFKLKEAEDETDGVRGERDEPDGGRLHKQSDDDSAMEDDEGAPDDTKGRKLPEGQDLFGTTHFSKSGTKEDMKPFIVARSKKQPTNENGDNAEKPKVVEVKPLDRRKKTDEKDEEVEKEEDDEDEEEEEDDDDDEDEEDDDEEDSDSCEEPMPKKGGLSLSALAGHKPDSSGPVAKATNKKEEESEREDESNAAGGKTIAAKNGRTNGGKPVKIAVKPAVAKRPVKRTDNDDEDEGEEDGEEGKDKNGTFAKTKELPKHGAKTKPGTSRMQTEDEDGDEGDDEEEEEEEEEEDKPTDSEKTTETKTESGEQEPKAWQFWKKKKKPETPEASTTSPTASTTSTSSSRKPGDQGGSRTCVIV